MGSVNSNNFPTYKDKAGNAQFGKLTSSVMEYAITYDDTYWNNGAHRRESGRRQPEPGWLPYDAAAIAWI